MEFAVRFKDVYKEYPFYQHITAGLKSFLFQLPKNLSSFRKTRFIALNNVSLDIRKGETFGIIGRNGSGKSTMLGLMAGVLRQDRGTVETEGKISSLLELGAGFHPDLSGIENIILNGILMGNTREEMERKVEAIIDFSELGDFIYQPLRTYSSGMHVRLGFSVAVHVDPEILLIDEALAVGDVAFQEKCLARMKEFRNSGVTIILVSHDREAIEKLCDRAAWLKNGLIKGLGNPAEVMEQYLDDVGQGAEHGASTEPGIGEPSESGERPRSQPVWWEVPAVVKEYEHQITGSRSLHFYDFLKKHIPSPLEKGLCIPHRLRGMEENFVTYGICTSFDTVHGNDAVDRIIRGEDIGMSGAYDLVLCIDLLSHMENPELFLKKVKPLLSRNGYIIVMEYTGPQGFRYPEQVMRTADSLFSLICGTGMSGYLHKGVPGEFHRTVRKGENSSGRIEQRLLPAIGQSFAVADVRPFGGPLLDILISRIVTLTDCSSSAGEAFLSRLIAFEESLIRGGLFEYSYAVIIARHMDARIL